jgi:hypothetical protein
LRIFPAVNERPAQENMTCHREGNFERGSVSILKISKFKEANKKLIIVYGSEKLSKILKSVHTKYRLKMFRPKKYQSCGAVP